MGVEGWFWGNEWREINRKIVERNLLKTVHIEREKDFETPRGQTLHVGGSLCLSIKVKYIVFF